MNRLRHGWRRVKGGALRALGRVPEPRPILPANPMHDDLYLVEFPKSGVTWLCFLMANVNLLLSGDKQQQVTFFNLHAFIPEVHASGIVNVPAFMMPRFRMLKSHAEFTTDYPRVFYLVR